MELKLPFFMFPTKTESNNSEVRLQKLMDIIYSILLIQRETRDGRIFYEGGDFKNRFVIYH